MKKFCFIVSHLGSGSSVLVDYLSKYSKIAKISIPCDTLDVLSCSLPIAPLLLSENLHNIHLISPQLYRTSKFIYLIREPKYCLGECSLMYYKYRLRKMTEMAKRTFGVLLYSDNINKDLIEDYLEISDFNLNLEYKEYNGDISKAQDCYERHLYFLKQYLIS